MPSGVLPIGEREGDRGKGGSKNWRTAAGGGGEGGQSGKGVVQWLCLLKGDGWDDYQPHIFSYIDQDEV